MIKIKAVFLVIMSVTIAAGCSDTQTKDDRFREQLITNSRTQVYQLVKTKAEQDGYSAEGDHVIPWQTEHVFSWRTSTANAVSAFQS